VQPHTHGVGSAPDQGRVPRVGDHLHAPGVAGGALEYELRVAGSMNCSLEPCEGLSVLCVATRDIAEGEEVLAPHGYMHWCKMQEWFLSHSEKVEKEKSEILMRFL